MLMLLQPVPKIMLLRQRNLLAVIVLISISLISVLRVEAQLEEWCIADEQASDAELQSALDWACGKGGADCSKIQKDQPCYLPNTVKDHASFAFNSYFQKYKNKGGTCYFKSAALITGVDPRGYSQCRNWCIADHEASDELIQKSLDWVCVNAKEACNRIQPGQPCYKPNDLRAVASAAFNDYWQIVKHAPGAKCDIFGAAILVDTDPILQVEAGVWCIANEHASDAELQSALDYACGAGADCTKIQEYQPCYFPNTVKDHASYAFNSYFQKNNYLPHSCDFGSAAVLTTLDPRGYSQCKNWCIANEVPDAVIQKSLDWVCVNAKEACNRIQPGQPCYKPNDLRAVASVAFNDYWQRVKHAPGAKCEIYGAAILVDIDPSMSLN
uniref:X8 domain-containing protein n=1 Tax=Chenopodium quinoa TaxID=63459 RepID=A0A803M1J9_CHEQI